MEEAASSGGLAGLFGGLISTGLVACEILSLAIESFPPSGCISEGEGGDDGFTCGLVGWALNKMSEVEARLCCGLSAWSMSGDPFLSLTDSLLQGSASNLKYLLPTDRE